MSVAVVFFGASGLTAVLPAGADPINSARSQVDAMQAEVAAGAARVHQLTTAFGQASVESSALGQEVAADQIQLAELRTEVASGKTLLEQEAILSYTGSATPPIGPAVGVTDPAVRAEYLQVAAGDIDQALDQYLTEQKELTSGESNLVRQQNATRAALNATASDRQQALDQAESEQAQLDALQGRLDQLVEAAAVATQEPPSDPTQGLPVNNGVVDLVRTIVSSPGSPYGPGNAGGVWLQLRECESSDDYQTNTGNGYYGAYQFSQQTWTGLGFPGRPDLEPPGMQDQAAMELQARSGWGQWPACSAALGLT